MAEARGREIPKWLLDARSLIEWNMDSAGGLWTERPSEFPDEYHKGYHGGYYDACRHALKALPPYVKYPDAEDWLEEGFTPPREPTRD